MDIAKPTFILTGETAPFELKEQKHYITETQ